MFSTRWFEAAALLTVVAAALPACRRYPNPPILENDASGIGVAIDAAAPDTNRPPPLAPGPTSDARLDDRPAPMTADPGQACGAAGQTCCSGSRCGGGCCHNGTCLALGDRCPERPELSCFGSSCGGDCGGLDQACCGATGYCTAPLTSCTRTDASSTCQACGNTGEPCCRDSYCEPPNRRCLNGRCATM